MMFRVQFIFDHELRHLVVMRLTIIRHPMTKERSRREACFAGRSVRRRLELALKSDAEIWRRVSSELLARALEIEPPLENVSAAHAKRNCAAAMHTHA